MGGRKEMISLKRARKLRRLDLFPTKKDVADLHERLDDAMKIFEEQTKEYYRLMAKSNPEYWNELV